jgi:hypothetical protein
MIPHFDVSEEVNVYRHTNVYVAVAAFLALAILACDEKAPTQNDEPMTPAMDEASLVSERSAIPMNISLPVDQNISTTATAPAFRIKQFGRGPNGIFQIINAASTQPALQALTNGRGRAGFFQNTNAANPEPTIRAETNAPGPAIQGLATGPGSAGVFRISRAASSASALLGQTAGFGRGVEGVATGDGYAGAFTNTSATNGIPALLVETRGEGIGGAFSISKATNQSAAVFAHTVGKGWAGHFLATSATGKGVFIETNGGAGLQVSGGTKNAVVGTSTGARALYTEESSEVWFTDYGFGRTEHGRARILIDPTFAQTINPDERYHVFLEEYGEAQLYVSERTPLGFVVRSIGGADVEFSYRLVAKRRGFEAKRLERAPWADSSKAHTN